MKLRTRMAIAAAAIILTFAGFNLLVSSSTLDVIRAGRMGGMEIVVTAHAPALGSPAHVS
jgi:hypothetical protein